MYTTNGNIMQTLASPICSTEARKKWVLIKNQFGEKMDRRMMEKVRVNVKVNTES
jgi:hypothetical protein